MGRKEIEEIIGTDLGKKRSSRDPVLRAFQDRGVNISDHTVGGLRDGRKTGNALTDRLTSNEILQGKANSGKNDFIAQVSQTGLNLRSYQSGPNSHKLSSQGYVEDIAEALDVNFHAVSNILRTARFDLIYSEMYGKYPELPAIFRTVSKEYFQAFVEKKGTVAGRPAAQRLFEEWNRQTMKDFYVLLNNTMGARARGTWVPYEMAIFSELYKEQDVELSVFDRKVLLSYRDTNSFQKLVSEIELTTGMKADVDPLEDYKSILIHGWPIPPQKEAKYRSK